MRGFAAMIAVLFALPAAASEEVFHLSVVGDLGYSRPVTQGFAAGMGARPGLGGAIRAELPLWAPDPEFPFTFSVEGGLMLIGRGFVAGRTNIFAPQLQLPIGLKTWFDGIPFLPISATGGVSLGYPISSMSGSNGARYAYSELDLNRLDPGVFALVGATLPLTDYYGLLAEAGYTLSVLNVYTGTADATWRWHDFHLFLGVRFSF